MGGIIEAMIDAHVHIEEGPYTLDWIDRFVRVAQSRGITELRLLEHSHRFTDFFGVYASILGEPACGAYQGEWLQRSCILGLQQYQSFVAHLRRKHFPLALRFGLEVCYFPEMEAEIQRLLSDFDWDFVTGSIHWIDGWGFDHEATKEQWLLRNVDEVYEEYYRLMIKLVNSRLFTTLAHPDSIKCFHHYPNRDVGPLYDQLAEALQVAGVSAEISCGLRINYGHPEIGPNRDLLYALRSRGINMVTASDAHRPEDVGRYIDQATRVLRDFS
jgi:histidinol-phosphatase (PHP family)